MNICKWFGAILLALVTQLEALAGGPIKVGSGFHFANYFPGQWAQGAAPDLVVRDAQGTLFLYPFVNTTFVGGGGAHPGRSRMEFYALFCRGLDRGRPVRFVGA